MFDELMVRFVVDAFAENVFDPPPVMMTFASADEPVMVPESVRGDVPEKVVVPVPAVKVPLFA